jgi:hypothetical protein
MKKREELEKRNQKKNMREPIEKRIT